MSLELDEDFLLQITNMAELLPEPHELLDDDCLICECFCVSAGDIRKVSSETVDLTLLKAKFHLGTGCQSCIKNFESWKDKIFTVSDNPKGVNNGF